MNMSGTDTAVREGRRDSVPVASGPSTSRIRRNLATLLVSQFATQIATLLALCIVPRYLGAASYGELAFAISFVGFFALVASLGSRQYLVKQIARNPDQLADYVVNAFILKAVLGAVLGLLAIATAQALGYPPETVLVIGATAIGMLLTVLADVLVAALQAIDRVGEVGLWLGVQQYVAGGIGIGLVLAHRSIAWYALAIGAGPAIQIVANGRRLWALLKDHLVLKMSIWKDVIRGGLPFALWAAVLLVYGSIDIVMLHQMDGSRTVGWYTLAYTWVGVPVAFPFVLSAAVFPSLSTTALAASSEFIRTVNNAIRLVILVGTPMAVGMALIANNIIGLFHYSSDFSHAVPLIRILALHIPIVAMDMVLALALMAKDRERAWLLVGGLAAVVNPAFNLLAIPWAAHRYANGAIGAAVVTVGTELLMMVGAICLRPPGVLDRATSWYVIRVVVASAAMVPAIIFIPDAPLGAKVLVGAAVFIAVSFAVGLFTVERCRAILKECRHRLMRRDGLHFAADPGGPGDIR
jgi:O-antigen/teichoic acid export membrane protein